MQTLKLILMMGCLFAIFGIVGHLDYEDAVLMAHANDTMRLVCQRTIVAEQLVYGRSPMNGQLAYQPITFNLNDERPSPAFQELRCIVVDE
jgi:hypothetical protein